MCVRPVLISTANHSQLVPCGKCLPCRLKNAKQWTFRNVSELPYHENSCIITLTYDSEIRDCPEGLQHRDFQLFIKRLRKKISPKKIKYFMCGEYGDTNGRPHYHSVIYGWLPADLKKNSFTGSLYSRTVDSLWGLSYNNVVDIPSVEGVKYICGYVTKKLYTRTLAERDDSYIRCSQGIGLRYARENSEQLKRDLNVRLDGTTLSLPRYFSKKLDIPSEDLYDKFLQNNSLLQRSLSRLYSDPRKQHKVFLAYLKQLEYDLSLRHDDDRGKIT